MGKGRLEAFADGVFAIAATLLVLHVTVDAPGGRLGHALVHAWPQYAAYALSFLMIGTWWVSHHAYLGAIDRVDRTFLWANLAFLAFVAFLPFPTQLVAEHFRDHGLRAAVIVYGVTLTGAATSVGLMWLYAAHGRRLISPGADAAMVARYTREIMPGAPACATATLLALWTPYATLVVISLALVFYVFGGGVFQRR